MCIFHQVHLVIKYLLDDLCLEIIEKFVLKLEHLVLALVNNFHLMYLSFLGLLKPSLAHLSLLFHHFNVEFLLHLYDPEIIMDLSIASLPFTLL